MRAPVAKDRCPLRRLVFQVPPKKLEGNGQHIRRRGLARGYARITMVGRRHTSFQSAGEECPR